MNLPDPGPGVPFDEAHSIKSAGMGLATAGLICGIAGLLFLGIILGPLAIIFGAIGLAQARKNAIGAGKSLATASLVIGIIDVAWFIINLAQAVHAVRHY